MSKPKNRFSPSVVTIITSILTFLGIFVTGYFSIRSAERPVQLVISATQTASANSIIIPTITSSPIAQENLKNSITSESISINVLRPSQGETHPLFRGEFEFATYTTEPIIVEFVVIDATGKSVDTQQVFTVPENGFDIILYLPDYTYKKFSISPVNKDSSLNNRYYAKIKTPPSNGEFLEGEYTLEIKPDLKYVNPSFRFDEKSYLVKFNINNILDMEKIFMEVFVFFIVFFVACIALLNFYIQRHFSQKPNRST